MVMNDMTDDGKWGAAIRTDGQRPEWLSGRQTCQMYTGVIGHGGWCTWLDAKPIQPAESWAWSHQSGEPNITQIRLPASHPHYQQAQTQTLTAQERLERMEALVRKMAKRGGGLVHQLSIGDYDEARALVAEMEPVDPDEERARDLAAKLASVTLPASNPAHSGFAAAGKVNEYISRPTTEAERMIACMYRGIKEGRELARGEG